MSLLKMSVVIWLLWILWKIRKFNVTMLLNSFHQQFNVPFVERHLKMIINVLIHTSSLNIWIRITIQYLWSAHSEEKVQTIVQSSWITWKMITKDTFIGLQKNTTSVVCILWYCAQSEKTLNSNKFSLSLYLEYKKRCSYFFNQISLCALCYNQLSSWKRKKRR